MNYTSMEFSRPEYWSGWPFPSPGDLSNPGIAPRSPAWQMGSLPAEPPGKPHWHRKRSVKDGCYSKLSTKPFPFKETTCDFLLFCFLLCICFLWFFWSHGIGDVWIRDSPKGKRKKKKRQWNQWHLCGYRFDLTQLPLSCHMYKFPTEWMHSNIFSVLLFLYIFFWI